MRKNFLFAVVLALAVLTTVPQVYAQGGVKAGPDPSTIRDPDLEKDSFHNLEVARNYFKLKKAYVAAFKRVEEIIAGNPTFSKIDEALFIAGESSLALAEKKGKQDPSLYISFDGTGKRTLTSEQFREMGREYLTQLVTDHPDSSFRKEAEDHLLLIGGPSAVESMPIKP